MFCETYLKQIGCRCYYEGLPQDFDFRKPNRSNRLLYSKQFTR
jgi:hypothetical protein